MPYISTAKVKEIRDELKTKLPEYKFSVVREHHSKVNVSIMEGPLNLAGDHINPFWIEDNFKNEPEKVKLYSSIKNIINAGNRIIAEDGDYGSIPQFYINIQVGKWDKPYQQITSKFQEPKKIEIKEGKIKLIDYSEKSIAIIGETKEIKNTLSKLGGRFNYHLSCGPGWIFPKTKLDKIKSTLNL